jgi:mannose-6-phosphate isomerase-like protein (cupin superfamily)
VKSQYLIADVHDADEIKRVSRAITNWDPLLSLKVTRGESLYGGILTSYGLSIGHETTLSFRDRSQRIRTGDAIVVPPSLRIAAQPSADFLWICYEGLAPEHLRGQEGLAAGFDHFSLEQSVIDQSICGQCRPVLPTDDLRYRVQYHYVETENAQPHTHADMIELYYVLSGEGEMRTGLDMQELAAVPVRSGQVMAIGPELYHLPSNGLGLCIWFLSSEMAYRRRAASQSQREPK